MKYLTYTEALEICQDKAQQLVNSRSLNKWCEENKVDYHNVLVYIRGNKKDKKYPKLIAEFLKKSGYSDVTIEKKTIYNFIIEEE